MWVIYIYICTIYNVGSARNSINIAKKQVDNNIIESNKK